MRALLLVAVASATVVQTSSAMRVDGVPVYGRLHDVELRDIRDAIRVGASHGSVFKVEVLDPRHINVHLRNLGYIPTWRFAHDHDWAFDHPYMWDPEVLHLIKAAREVYVFPVTTPARPHRDDKRMRLLLGPPRRDIVGLLGRERNWYVGQYTLLGTPKSTTVGLLFRQGKNELVLFFSGEVETILAEGSFNGQYVADILEQKPGKKFAQWTRRYAQIELAAK